MSTTKPSETQMITITENLRALPLLKGTRLKCPHCEKEKDILEYVPLEYSEKYAKFVVPPLKCKDCSHVFALHPNPE